MDKALNYMLAIAAIEVAVVGIATAVCYLKMKHDEKKRK